MKKLLCSVLLSTVLCFQAQGERMFSHINTSNSALPSDVVQALCQDSQGFIWIGTATGVSRYDGVRIVNFDKETLGLKSSFILNIAEDKDGIVWVSSSSGVSRYDYKTASFEPFDLKTDDGEVITHQANTMVCDEAGDMWMSVNEQGLFRYDHVSKSLDKYPIRFRRFDFDMNGRLWVSTYFRNLMLVSDDFERVMPARLGDRSDVFANDQIQMLRFSRKDSDILYIASVIHGLCVVNIRTGEMDQLYTFPKNTYLNSAFLEGEDRWWAATSDGVFCYDFHTGEVEVLKHSAYDSSISGNYAFTAIVDQEGGLWIGTKDGGVDYSNPCQNRFTKVFRTSSGESLEKMMVSGFAEDSQGRIWVTSEQGGLYLYRPTGELEKLHLDNLPKTLVSPVVVGDQLWLGSLEGLFRLDTKNMRVKAYGGLLSADGVRDLRVYNVIVTKGGEVFATSTRGLDRYVPEQDRFLPVTAVPPEFFTDVLEDGNGTLWLSSFYFGIKHYDPATDKLLSSYSIENGLPDNRVTSLCIDRNNTVWAIGFSSGFSRLDTERTMFSVMNKDNVPSMLSNIFYQALIDGNGRMWLSSGDGLVLYNPQTSVAKVFREEDGILDAKFTNSALSCRDGRLLFGSDNGFIVVNPHSALLSGDAPDVVITEMKIGDSVVNGNVNAIREHILKPYQNTFSFAVAFPGSFSLPGKSIQYMMDGYDDTWKLVQSDGILKYYNVPSGHYQLKFRSPDSSGSWVECHYPVKLVINKPFFLTARGIASILLILAAIFAVVILYMARLSDRKRVEQENEYKQKKDQELFYEKMNFFSHVIHEIKTPLTLIRTPLDEMLGNVDMPETVQHDLQLVHNNTEYLSDLVNELLEFVRVEKHGYILSKQPLNLEERVEFLVLNYTDTATSKGIRIEFRKPEEPCWISADSSALNKILNNLILNAVKYAGTYIGIKLSVEADSAVIRISNDGEIIPHKSREEIFQPFVRHSSSDMGFGIGLPLARSLAQMHSGSLTLSDEDTTCFILTLPLASPPSDEEGEDNRASQPSSLPTILVVDDNADIRDYLIRKLSDAYNVICCDNGSTAIRQILSSDIDLVITDITMNGMDGLELCKAVRQNIEVSHIPIIVLSARSSVESKIQAMECGADLYVEKPFNLEFLKASVNNILERRNLMKRALSTGVSQPDIKMFGLPDRDEEFFRKLNSIIDENISSSELNNNFLASRLAVSEATLIRKIKKMLDTTPVDYIRTKRLNLASTMLKKGCTNLTEVAYEVGFSSLAYFSKCFKDRYGCSPSEYIAK